MELLLTFLIVIVFWVIIIGLGYLLDVLIAMLPAPAPIARILHIAIWVVVVVACLIVLIAGIRGELPRMF